jgi:transcriptional regulator with XRE-family HTH domain
MKLDLSVFALMTKFKDESFLKEFGEHLRLLRSAKGLSQEALAHRADIPVSQIGRIERGEINTTVSTANLLAKILELPVKNLFDF